ncbi:MAG: DUF4430 domain-containing protein [Candidatus Kerfeldbacteria bacterium]|nr:DUF4430 domain-containing protein [Candidatus Kerfeldbacteria bacterium]
MAIKKILLPVALVMILTGAGCSLTQTVTVNTNAVVANTNTQTNAAANTNATTSTIIYSGHAGKTALELLQATHKVDASSAGFVNSIDGTKPGTRQYWAFYVNGKLADVGAKSYQTKDTETIEWRLDSF